MNDMSKAIGEIGSEFTRNLAAKDAQWKVLEKGTILVFGKTLELETSDDGIIAISTKMSDETLWTSPSDQIWSKMSFNT
jgi:hypothetical protein